MPDFNHSVLVVDDEVAIRSLIKRYFERCGALVYCAGSGDEMYRILANQQVDLVLLDVQLPGKNGFELLNDLKREYPFGVIMLTAHNELNDRLTGLNGGADDYVPKPFDMSELLARSKAVLRRFGHVLEIQAGAVPDTGRYCFNQYCLDSKVRVLYGKGKQQVDLSPAEFDLLYVFVKHPQTVLSRDYLLQQTRGRDATAYDRTIDVRVGQLRKKLQQANDAEGIFKTIRGGGYMLACEVS